MRKALVVGIDDYVKCPLEGCCNDAETVSNELAKNGGFLSKAWYYSTELRVLNTQIFYKLAFLISPSNLNEILAG